MTGHDASLHASCFGERNHLVEAMVGTIKMLVEVKVNRNPVMLCGVEKKREKRIGIVCMCGCATNSVGADSKSAIDPFPRRNLPYCRSRWHEHHNLQGEAIRKTLAQRNQRLETA